VGFAAAESRSSDCETDEVVVKWAGLVELIDNRYGIQHNYGKGFKNGEAVKAVYQSEVIFERKNQEMFVNWNALGDDGIWNILAIYRRKTSGNLPK
jgi:hypothetical protein